MLERFAAENSVSVHFGFALWAFHLFIVAFRLGAVFALLPPTIQAINYGVKNLCKVFLTIFVIVLTNRLE